MRDNIFKLFLKLQEEASLHVRAERSHPEKPSPVQLRKIHETGPLSVEQLKAYRAKCEELRSAPPLCTMNFAELSQAIYSRITDEGFIFVDDSDDEEQRGQVTNDIPVFVAGRFSSSHKAQSISIFYIKDS